MAADIPSREHRAGVTLYGVDYELTLGSDVSVRDGMYLEASLRNTDPLVQVAEVFFSDDSGRFFVTCFEPNLPMELIALLIAEAKMCLPSTR